MTSGLDDLCRDLPHFLVQRNDFQYQRKIGSGSFGDVYLATYIPTGQTVAVKELKHETLEEPYLQYYLREIRILAKCDNYFLLHFTGFTVSNPFLIVTEYIPNGSLFDRIHDKANKLDGTQKTIIAMGIACGMARLHFHGIMHRDLKSLNILLDEKFYPRVCDFGAGRAKNTTTEYVTQNIGTVHWMAPEMFDSNNYTLAVDIYAYAILLWELLAEQIPYQGMSVTQIMRTVCMDNQRLPIPNGTPPNLQKLIQLCWNKDPEKRPPFDRIFKIFKSHRVGFPGCDDAKVDAALADIEAAASAQKCHSLIINGMAGSPQEQQQHSNEELENMYKIVSSGDAAKIDELAKTITGENCNLFYETIWRNLNQQNSTISLTALLKILVMNQECLAEFVRRGYHNNLPLNSDENTKISLSILLPVFEIFPRFVTEDLLNKIIPTIPKFGFKICRLISVFCTNFNEVENPWKVSDILILKALEFITSGAAVPLMETLFGLLSKYEFFRNARLANCLSIFVNRLQSNQLSEVIAAYDCLNGLQIPQVDVDPMLIASHLDNPNVTSHAIQFLAKTHIKRATPILIDTILRNQNVNHAMQALCRCSMIAPKDVIDKFQNYMGNKKYPADLQLKTVMTIALNEESRKIIAKSPNLITFLNYVVVPDNESLSALSALVKKLPLDGEMVDKIGESGFLKNYIKTVISRNDIVVYSNCFVMIDCLCRISYLSDSLEFLQISLQTLQQVPQLQQFAISYLLLLSGLPAAAAEMKRQNVISYVDSMNLPENIKRYIPSLKHNLSQ